MGTYEEPWAKGCFKWSGQVPYEVACDLRLCQGLKCRLLNERWVRWPRFSFSLLFVFWGLRWLIMLRKFQVCSSVIHHLSVPRCAHHQSSLLPSPCHRPLYRLRPAPTPSPLITGWWRVEHCEGEKYSFIYMPFAASERGLGRNSARCSSSIWNKRHAWCWHDPFCNPLPFTPKRTFGGETWVLTSQI